MAARRGNNTLAAKQSKHVKHQKNSTNDSSDKSGKELAEEHLPPLPLIFVVLICSGFLFVMAMRDVLATGKVIAGPWDRAMLAFTKSHQWFDDSQGWRSKQGGLSEIQSITTDVNNMGGFFVRKLAGVAAMTVQLQKLLPLLVHVPGSQWILGHFYPLLYTSLISNVCLIAFYAVYMEDLSAAGAADLPLAFVGLLSIETLVFSFYLFRHRPTTRKAPAVAMTEGKTPTSPASRIVTRTITLVSSVMTLIACRDLFFPGYIFDFIPRDDIYLEWTNALMHSPPEGTPEAIDQGLEAPLFIGDKFMSQLLALNILINCLYKFASAFLIRYGSDGSGVVKCKMIWRAQAIGDGLLLFLLRLFTPAASSASLDLRWHLMSVGYEMFILGLYGYF